MSTCFSAGENKDEAEKGKDEENNEGREKDTDDKNKEQRTTEHCRQPVNNEQKDLITGPVLDKTGDSYGVYIDLTRCLMSFSHFLLFGTDSHAIEM